MAAGGTSPRDNLFNRRIMRGVATYMFIVVVGEATVGDRLEIQATRYKLTSDRRHKLVPHMSAT